MQYPPSTTVYGPVPHSTVKKRPHTLDAQGKSGKRSPKPPLSGGNRSSWTIELTSEQTGGWPQVNDATLSAIWAKIRKKILRKRGVDATALFMFDYTGNRPIRMVIFPEVAITLGSKNKGSFVHYTAKLAKILNKKALPRLRRCAFKAERLLASGRHTPKEIADVLFSDYVDELEDDPDELKAQRIMLRRELRKEARKDYKAAAKASREAKNLALQARQEAALAELAVEDAAEDGSLSPLEYQHLCEEADRKRTLADHLAQLYSSSRELAWRTRQRFTRLKRELSSDHLSGATLADLCEFEDRYRAEHSANAA